MKFLRFIQFTFEMPWTFRAHHWMDGFRIRVRRRAVARRLKAPKGPAKINVDEAISCHKDRGTSVAICRDETGK